MDSLYKMIVAYLKNVQRIKFAYSPIRIVSCDDVLNINVAKNDGYDTLVKQGRFFKNTRIG